LFLFASPLTLVRASDKSAPDLEGTWKPVTAELAGKKYPQQILDTMTLVLKDNKWRVVVEGKNDEGTFKHDPSKSPKTMNITGTNGPNNGKTYLVIYELKGDEMRVCYDLTTKSRPTEFATKPDTMLYLVTYRREKK
jgi:uncharacterized protein (TIGR03067 family)